MPQRAVTFRQNWRATDNDSLHLKTWDDETVVYDEFSGDTHLLSSFAGEILSRLCQLRDPISAETIAYQLALELAIDRDASFDLALSTCLEEFQRLGMVERVEV